MTDPYYYETVVRGLATVYEIRERGKGRLLPPFATCTEVAAAEKTLRALNHVENLDRYIKDTLFVGLDFSKGGQDATDV